MTKDSFSTVRLEFARGGRLAFDLREVIAAFGNEAIKSWWSVGGVKDWAGRTFERGPENLFEAHGLRSDELSTLRRSRTRIYGQNLKAIADAVDQVVWGEFQAFHSAKDVVPWAIVKAVDSTFYEIASDKTWVERVSLRLHSKCEVAPNSTR